MRRFPSIKKNRDFQSVYRRRKSFANRLLVMYVREVSPQDGPRCQGGPCGLDDGPITRIGISVSKKVGNSVVRHRVTRLVRESFRLHRNELKPGLDIVVVAREAAKDSDYHAIERAFMHLCGLHKIKEELK